MLADFRLPNVEKVTSDDTLLGMASAYCDPYLTWDTVTWLKSITKLPIVIKGIQSGCAYAGSDLRGPRGPRPPINRGPPTKPFKFYFSLMIDAYETTT